MCSSEGSATVSAAVDALTARLSAAQAGATPVTTAVAVVASSYVGLA
ncbi:hypothetical protein [Mycobacterium haemophilum]|nr:hypothetical protein [Mycobacterium haemophilum]MCV7340835.1 hypothetical protein [Mycobacterium haemophilum DSM 44634]